MDIGLGPIQRLTRRLSAAPANAAKRGFGLLAAMLLVVFLLPQLLAVAAGIVWDSKGPVLHLQRRTRFSARPSRSPSFGP